MSKVFVDSLLKAFRIFWYKSAGICVEKRLKRPNMLMTVDPGVERGIKLLYRIVYGPVAEHGEEVAVSKDIRNRIPQRVIPTIVCYFIITTEKINMSLIRFYYTKL